MFDRDLLEVGAVALLDVDDGGFVVVEGTISEYPLIKIGIMHRRLPLRILHPAGLPAPVPHRAQLPSHTLRALHYRVGGAPLQLRFYQGFLTVQ